MNAIVPSNQTNIPQLPVTVSGLKGGEEAGRWELTRTLTTEERRQIEAVRDQCLNLLQSTGGEQAKAQAVTALFAAFPAKQNSTAEMKLELFMQATKEIPVWAVQRACRWWNSGVNLEPTDNPAFPPSPPQLAIMARKATGEVAVRLKESRKILSAREPFQKTEHSEEMQARINGLLRNFRQTISNHRTADMEALGMTVEKPEDNSVEACRARLEALKANPGKFEPTPELKRSMQSLEDDLRGKGVIE